MNLAEFIRDLPFGSTFSDHATEHPYVENLNLLLLFWGDAYPSLSMKFATAPCNPRRPHHQHLTEASEILSSPQRCLYEHVATTNKDSPKPFILSRVHLPLSGIFVACLLGSGCCPEIKPTSISSLPTVVSPIISLTFYLLKILSCKLPIATYTSPSTTLESKGSVSINETLARVSRDITASTRSLVQDLRKFCRISPFSTRNIRPFKRHCFTKHITKPYQSPKTSRQTSSPEHSRNGHQSEHSLLLTFRLAVATFLSWPFVAQSRKIRQRGGSYLQEFTSTLLYSLKKNNWEISGRVTYSKADFSYTCNLFNCLGTLRLASFSSQNPSCNTKLQTPALLPRESTDLWIFSPLSSLNLQHTSNNTTDPTQRSLSSKEPNSILNIPTHQLHCLTTSIPKTKDLAIYSIEDPLSTSLTNISDLLPLLPSAPSPSMPMDNDGLQSGL